MRQKFSLKTDECYHDLISEAALVISRLICAFPEYLDSVCTLREVCMHFTFFFLAVLQPLVRLARSKII